MRIAMVCYPTYGGSGVVATELGMLLADRGHEVHLVSYEVPFRIDRWRPNLIFHAVDISDYPLFRYPPYTLNLTNKLIEVVVQHRLEIIHSSRLACTLHGTDITVVGREQSFFELTRFAMKHQDLLTTPSTWLANETAEHFHIDQQRVHVVPNFVDLERFKPDAAATVRACLAPAGQRIITHASNFRPVKRIEEVVRAFATIRSRMPAVLVLMGDGPELPKAEHLARELGVRDDLRILGQQDKLEAVLQASDLFLLPSRAESFGLAALEAMACGVPVLGYAAGGLPEVVENNVSGILCAEGSDVCLGTLGANLIEDQPRYQTMRLAARARAEQFAAKKIADQYERLLGGLIPAKARESK
jgi:N-acetyl-alpha-D-glucosaminyl L-malate synthase BshA